MLVKPLGQLSHRVSQETTAATVVWYHPVAQLTPHQVLVEPVYQPCLNCEPFESYKKIICE